MTAPLLLARGMVVELANPSSSGRPQRRLVVVLQADRWLQHHPTLTCCPLTRRLVAAGRLAQDLVGRPLPSRALRAALA